MDAVEYVKTQYRLCRSKNNCSECPLQDKENCCCILDTIEYAEKAVQIVEQWAKDHPVKTRQSEFLKLFPNAAIYEDDGILCIKPCTIDGSIGCTKGKGCDDCYRKYWKEEVSE